MCLHTYYGDLNLLKLTGNNENQLNTSKKKISNENKSSAKSIALCEKVKIKDQVLFTLRGLFGISLYYNSFVYLKYCTKHKPI